MKIFEINILPDIFPFKNQFQHCTSEMSVWVELIARGFKWLFLQLLLNPSLDAIGIAQLRLHSIRVPLGPENETDTDDQEESIHSSWIWVLLAMEPPKTNVDPKKQFATHGKWSTSKELAVQAWGCEFECWAGQNAPRTAAMGENDKKILGAH